jgi:hypothetical protein
MANSGRDELPAHTGWSDGGEAPERAEIVSRRDRGCRRFLICGAGPRAKPGLECKPHPTSGSARELPSLTTERRNSLCLRLRVQLFRASPHQNSIRMSKSSSLTRPHAIGYSESAGSPQRCLSRSYSPAGSCKIRGFFSGSSQRNR